MDNKILDIIYLLLEYSFNSKNKHKIFIILKRNQEIE